MSKIIKIAEREIGVTEHPKDSNNTKYNKWFGLPSLPWCGMFVSWCYDKAGFPLGKIGFLKGFAGCQTAVAHFKKTGEITKSPVPGDIVFFDWNGDGRYDHVGLFEKWIEVPNQPKMFQTIEGNTSLHNDSNGGNVMRRKRNTKGVIFVHPKVLDK